MRLRTYIYFDFKAVLEALKTYFSGLRGRRKIRSGGCQRGRILAGEATKSALGMPEIEEKHPLRRAKIEIYLRFISIFLETG